MAPSMVPPLRRRRAPAGPLAALMLLVAACGERPRPPERVVLCVLDALHAAHLSCYGGPPGITPSLDGVAAAGARFDRAVSTATWTLASTASLFTGRLQESHGVVTDAHALPPDLVGLPELFRAAGWRTASFVQMAYASHAYGFERGFDDYRYYGFAGGPLRESMPEDVQAWMAAHAGERYLLYLHFRRPHGVYNPFPGMAAPFEGDCPLAGGARDAELAHADTLGERELPAEERAHVEHLYRGNLATVDRRLAPILRRALADPALLLVVTSDHGEGLGEHGWFGHGGRLWAEGVDVPLLVAGPGVRPGVVDVAPAATVDVLPTLADLCGVSLARALPLDGVSLRERLAGPAPAPERTLFLAARYRPKARAGGRGGPELGAVRGDLKVVLEPDGSVRAHDRAADRGDRRELAGERADVAELARELAARRERYRDLGLPPEERVSLTPELRADLDALGYAEGD